MLVITAIVGNSFRNERSLSSASATMNSPLPSRALLPKALSRPPITAVGSRPQRSSTTAIIEVVVVLPCAPATAIENRSRINSASISARGMTGICRRVASTTSGLVGRTADETTTTSASPTWRAALAPPGLGRRARRGAHHDIGSAEVAGIVAERNANPEGRQPFGDHRSLLVGAADDVAEIREQFRDPALPDAADADEVHEPRPTEH